MNADVVIATLGLEPLPEEGGMFRRFWADEHGSAIWFLLRPGDFSALHRLTGPELWHHYAGAPVRMLLLRGDGTVERPLLGDDLAGGETPVVVVEAGTWMGAETAGDWSLVGATMAPPFVPEMFELGERATLAAAYPEAAGDIARLTR